jgi:hypothetical protein
LFVKQPEFLAIKKKQLNKGKGEQLHRQGGWLAG